MIVLVCGDRNWSRLAYLVNRLDVIHADTPITRVVEGDARGADRMAGIWAGKRGIDTLVVPALWEQHDSYGAICRCWNKQTRRCRGAGPIRNQHMLDIGKPDLVVAFHPDIEQSRGTGDMVRRARAAGLPVIVLDGS